MPRFITRIQVRNYKSIASCDVKLHSLSILVGRNGAGKSNFLDAIDFIADSLVDGPESAILSRGGINSVRRWSGGRPNDIDIRLDFRLDATRSASYNLSVGAKKGKDYVIKDEVCSVINRNTKEVLARFQAIDGNVVSSEPTLAFFSDRLYLTAASNQRNFRAVYAALSHMVFYDFNTAELREPQSPALADYLLPDGRNIGSVLREMERRFPKAKQRIVRYLSRITDDIIDVKPRTAGSRIYIDFEQQHSDGAVRRFSAASMSLGTIRVLALLVALFQEAAVEGARVGLIGIEEPEIALHPGALAVLLDAMEDASEDRQVILTSHSTDMLDRKDLHPRSILYAEMIEGDTIVRPLSEVSTSAIMDRMYTPGELLRTRQLA